MAIYNNANLTTPPVKTGGGSALKKNEPTPEISELSPVVSKLPNTDFSLVLSSQQEKSLNDTLGYDQPTEKERGAVNAYTDVANQQKREEIINSMSFHFVV